MISVIIPSRNNPEAIQRLRAWLAPEAEVIVIDNGDAPFNYSHMCNTGARTSSGDLLLFLNDDVECPSSDTGWMQSMVDIAMRPEAGAVGIKLLYPGAQHLIQHAGVVTDIRGPVHIWKNSCDDEVMADGANRGVHEVPAVTGAAMMVRRELYALVGGLDEEMPVSFNDIDCCYSLSDLGYRNYIDCEHYLVHHESATRDATLGEEHARSLARLYRKHPDLITVDEPHPDRRSLRRIDINGIREDACIQEGFEVVVATCIEGYAVVLGSDNHLYRTRVLVQSCDSGETWELPHRAVLRPDIAEALPDQTGVGSCGFRVALNRPLKEGCYRLGIMAVSKNHRQRFIHWNDHLMYV